MYLYHLMLLLFLTFNLNLGPHVQTEACLYLGNPFHPPSITLPFPLFQPILITYCQQQLINSLSSTLQGFIRVINTQPTCIPAMPKLSCQSKSESWDPTEMFYVLFVLTLLTYLYIDANVLTWSGWNKYTYYYYYYTWSLSLQSFRSQVSPTLPLHPNHWLTS